MFMNLDIIAKYRMVSKGNEKLFLMQEIRKLQSESYTLQDRYDKYRKDQDIMKLHKLKDGRIRLSTEGQDKHIYFHDVTSGKISYVMMYEILYNLDDSLVERFGKDLLTLLKILFIKGE